MSAPSKAKAWVAAARPKTLPAAISPLLIGTAIAYPNLDGVVLFATFVATILIQIATNFANDYYDFKKGADTEDRLGPQRATAQGWITPNAMRNGFVALFAMAFAIGTLLIWKAGWPILAIGIASIICGIWYTGGPYPLGYNGLGDITVFIFFGPVAVVGTVYCHTLTWSTEALVSSLGAGAITTAILVVNNQRDVITDRATGKMTLVARFGERFGTAEYFSMWILALVGLIVPAIIYGRWGVLISLPIVGIGFALAVRFARTHGAALNALLPKTAGLLFLYCATFSVGWLIYG